MTEVRVQIEEDPQAVTLDDLNYGTLFRYDDGDDYGDEGRVYLSGWDQNKGIHVIDLVDGSVSVRPKTTKVVPLSVDAIVELVQDSD